MNFKKTLIISVVTLTLATSAYAMRPGNGPNGGNPPGPTNLERLQDDLDLNDEQVVSLEKLFKEQKAKRREVRREKGKQRRAMREQMQKQLANILTPTQLEEFKSMKGKRKNCRNKQKRFNGDYK